MKAKAQLRVIIVEWSARPGAKSTDIRKWQYYQADFLKGVTVVSISCFVVDEIYYLRPVFAM